MPNFKDEHIIIIAPGSRYTLAQLGLPESFTPARTRVKSRMFPAPTRGEFEPSKIRAKPKAPNSLKSDPASDEPALIPQPSKDESAEEFEEDLITDEGAIWPMQSGAIVDWPCFLALMQHVHELLNAPFHTPILMIAQPCWTPKEHERLTQFFFEKFKCPAFAILDAASASCYAFNTSTAAVIDIGVDKADITVVNDFIVDSTGRTAALAGSGGEAMTKRLMQLLGAKGFSREMCEQLKCSSICEVLPPGTPLPKPEKPSATQKQNPAAAASTGVNGAGPAPGQSATSISDVPQGPGPNTAVGEGQREEEDNDGVLDVASIVTGGKMNEYLERKEKEKADKAAAKKKGQDAGVQNKPIRQRNAERERNSFLYEDHELSKSLQASDMSAAEVAEKSAALDEGPQRAMDEATQPAATTSNGVEAASHPTLLTKHAGPIRREIMVGTERFQAHTGDFMTDLGSALQRTIAAFPDPQRRSQFWDNLIVVGNGSRVRGFKEAFIANLQSRFVISPSSATMFTSEIPSTFSTPGPTGANTPQPGMGMQHRGNPLLYAATTAAGGMAQSQHQHSLGGASSTPYYPPQHLTSQSPSSIKLLKLSEYFPEWKEAGPEEAAFLGAQIAAKVIFNDNQGGTSKAFMSRSDWNETGPEGIHAFSL